MHHPLHTYGPFLAAALFMAVGVESVVGLWTKGRGLSPSTVLTNLSIILGELILRGLTFGVRMAAAAWVASLIPFSLPTTVTTVVVLYVLVDLVYYWRHRFLHSTRLGWAIHSTHHSSESLTILATFRLSWIEAGIRDFFYMPLLFLGFDPLLLVVLVELNAASQFWCHTDLIGRISWLDPWLNTPANHRRHHARDPGLAESNYGSTLMLWDRIFGTFNANANPTEFGIAGVKESKNPLVLEFGGLWRLYGPAPRPTSPRSE